MSTKANNEFDAIKTLIIAIFLTLPYTTGVLSYYFSLGVIGIQPKYYLAISALLACLAGGALPGRVGPLRVLLLALLGIRVVDALIFARIPDDETVNPLSSATSSFLYTIGVTFLSNRPGNLRLAGIGCATLTIAVCSAINLWEWKNSGHFSTSIGRSAGFLRNANGAAIAITAMLGLLLSLNPHVILASTLTALATVGVYCSLSRGGLLVLVAVVGTYCLMRFREFIRIAALAAIVIAFGLLLVRESIDLSSAPVAASNVEERLDMFQGRSEMRFAESDRAEVLASGLMLALSRPITGFGTAASSGFIAEPHNQLVAVWLDNGIVGPILYSAGLVLLVRRCIRTNRRLLIGCIPLVAQIPFSHNLLDDKSYLFVWGLLATYATIAQTCEEEAEINYVLEDKMHG